MVGDGEGGVDASGGSAKQSGLVLQRTVCEARCEGLDPEESFEGTLGLQGAVDAVCGEAREVVCAQEVIALGEERGEHAVADLQAEVEQGLCDVLALGLVGDIFDDAQEVAGVGGFFKGLCPPLGLEDSETGEDGIERVAGDGEAEVGIGVEEAEAKEVLVEQIKDFGASALCEGEAGALLLLSDLSQGLPGLLDLLGGGLVRIELEARAAAAVESWAVIHGAGPAKDDEVAEGARERLRTALCVEDELGQDAREESESAFCVGFVLWPLDGRTNLDGVAQGSYDIGRVIGWAIV